MTYDYALEKRDISRIDKLNALKDVEKVCLIKIYL